MATLHLMNTAMMPTEGLSYHVYACTPDKFVAAFLMWKQLDLGQWKSYIGYENTRQYLCRLLNVDVPMSREQTSVAAGDWILICKLKYRLQDPHAKSDKNAQAQVKDEDFELLICKVTEFMGEKKN